MDTDEEYLKWEKWKMQINAVEEQVLWKGG